MFVKKSMASIKLKLAVKDLFLELDRDSSGVYELKKTNSENVKQLVQDNERVILSELFMNDSDTMAHPHIAKALGITSQQVKNWRYDFKEGRSMSSPKYELLKKYYDLSRLFE